MKNIAYQDIVNEVAGLTLACSRLTPSCTAAMMAACTKERNGNARFALEMLIKNAEVASEAHLPVCQDTGMAVVFVKLGQEVHIRGRLAR